MWTIPVIAVALAVIVGLGVLRAAGVISFGGGTPIAVGKPVPADMLQQIATVPDSTWELAGASGAQQPILVPADPSAPTVLYVGAEYCPYCASERWSLVSALSRFGSFESLHFSASSSKDVYPKTPTFTFHEGAFRSDVLSFQAVEMQGREPGVNGRYTQLETMTSTQDVLFRKYNAPPYMPERGAGGIPFLLIGGKYMWVGSGVQPSLLAGKDWSEITASLHDVQSPAARSILANANEITAAICAVNGQQPEGVCTSPGVKAAAAKLPASGPTG